MSRFAELEVKRIIKETPDCVSIELDVPEERKEDFEFTAGQYLTFKQTINGEEVRRSYSLCSAPFEGVVKVAVKKVDGGRFSTFANEVLQVGDKVEVMKPMGRFSSRIEPNGAPRSYMFFAAGSGITPVISIIKDILHTQPESRVNLVYGNKGFDHIIFRDELQALKNLHLKRFSLFNVLSREILGEELYHGRINGQKCEAFFERLLKLEEMDEFFVCGPEEMINEVRNFLSEQGVPEDKVRFELFTTPGQTNQVSQTVEKVAVEDDTEKQDVTVIIDGFEHKFKLGSNDMSILDAANDIGADLPFACKGGVCCTCRAKLIKGEVNMDLNYSLQQDEIDKGFILTCQAHPVSDKVVVNFDIV